MEAYRLNVKLYLEASTDLDVEKLIPIFHRWIQDSSLGGARGGKHSLEGELLIDVADYKHVANGPGVMLIGHDANYTVESIDTRPGIFYGRKRFAEGDFAERLRDAFARTIRFGLALEREPGLGSLRVATDRWAFRINDRLLAPDTEETFRAVEPDLRELLADLFPEAELKLEREADAKAGFGVLISSGVAPNLAVLAQRLEAPGLPEAIAA